MLNRDYFKLEKKKDGVYRCKGGFLADVIFLLVSTFCLLILAILELPKRLILKILGK